MREELLEKLRAPSAEERQYLAGRSEILPDIYSGAGLGTVDRDMFLREGRLCAARPHARFIDFPEHSHNFAEIMYVIEGSITHQIGGKTLVMEKGDILLMNQSVRHRTRRAESGDIAVNFIALPEFFDIPLSMLGGEGILARFVAESLRRDSLSPHYLLFRLKGDAVVENLIENMILSLMTDRPGSEITDKYTMGLVFLQLMERADTLADGSTSDYDEIVVQSVLSYINRSYKDASLTKIAAELHQSVSSLSKLIRKKTGCTFKELLARKRFAQSMLLLADTDLSVGDIADSVGYEGTGYFFRRFKALYKTTPLKYRRTHRAGDQIKI